MNKKAVCFIVAGIICVAAALGLFVYNRLQSENAKKESESIVENLSAQIEQGTRGAEAFPTDNPDRVMPALTAEGGRYIGILSIPALGLELPVGEWLSDDAIQITPCLYSGSIYKHDMVIGAHNYDSHFGRISSLKFGDEVVFTDAENNVYKCEVVNLETLRPEQNDVLTQKTSENDWDISLFTCTYSGSERVAVRCSLK